MTSIANKVLQSSSLLVASKMMQRLIGLVSIMILARLLTPDDFAIVALTAIIIYFFDMLSNVGTEQYIIQKDHVTTQDLNTAWTIDLISKCTLWLVLMVSAGFISEYFEQPQLQSAIYVMSLLLPLNALKNPGTFMLKSELNYKRLFWLSLIQKLVSFTVVITIAILSPSFWALIVADIVASIIFLVGSYKIHNFRPKLSLINSSEQWLFSKWLLLKGIVGYIRSQIDTLFVSKLFNPSTLGQYYMARNIAMLPNHNLLTPAIEPLLAAFKVERKNKEKLAFQIRMSLLIVSLVAMPIAFFIWHFPEPIINTLLGGQWTSSHKLLSSMAPLFFYFPFLLVLEQTLLVKQKLKTLLTFDVFSLVTIIVALLTIQFYSVDELALYRGVFGIATTILLLFYVNHICRISLLKIISLSFPGLLSSLIAIEITDYLSQYQFDYVWQNLGYLGISFTLCYLCILVILLRLFFINTLEAVTILKMLRLI